MKITTSLAKLKSALNQQYTNGVATTPNALTSATASFVSGDVGKQIAAPTSIIKAGTTIATVTNGTDVVLTHPSGTAVLATGSPHSGVTFRIVGRERTSITIPLVTLGPGTIVREVINNAPAGVTSQHSVTKADGVLNETTTLVSATATFVARDVGKTVTATGIPADTKIASVTNTTTVVMDKAATATATSVSFTIVNRERLSAATMRVASGTHSYGTAKSALVANVPDVDVTAFLESMTASVVLSLTVALTGDNLSGLTGGSVDSFIRTGVLS